MLFQPLFSFSIQLCGDLLICARYTKVLGAASANTSGESEHIASYSGTPLYGHPDITDSSTCPDELKSQIFSLKLTRLIRTLRHVPLVSVLTGFHCNSMADNTAVDLPFLF